jgi:hypothetical protein
VKIGWFYVKKVRASSVRSHNSHQGHEEEEKLTADANQESEIGNGREENGELTAQNCLLDYPATSISFDLPVNEMYELL